MIILQDRVKPVRGDITSNGTITSLSDFYHRWLIELNITSLRDDLTQKCMCFEHILLEILLLFVWSNTPIIPPGEIPISVLY